MPNELDFIPPFSPQPPQQDGSESLFLVVQSERYGPYPLRQIADWAAAKHIPEGTLYCDGKEADWHPISKLDAQLKKIQLTSSMEKASAGEVAAFGKAAREKIAAAEATAKAQTEAAEKAAQEKAREKVVAAEKAATEKVAAVETTAKTQVEAAEKAAKEAQARAQEKVVAVEKAAKEKIAAAEARAEAAEKALKAAEKALQEKTAVLDKPAILSVPLDASKEIEKEIPKKTEEVAEEDDGADDPEPGQLVQADQAIPRVPNSTRRRLNVDAGDVFRFQEWKNEETARVTLGDIVLLLPGAHLSLIKPKDETAATTRYEEGLQKASQLLVQKNRLSFLERWETVSFSELWNRGLSRTPFCITLILLFCVFAGIVGIRATSGSGIIQVVPWVQTLFWCGIVVEALLNIPRLQNIGWFSIRRKSGVLKFLWCGFLGLLGFVPMLRQVIAIPCKSFPANFKKTSKIDLNGKWIFWVFALPAALVEILLWLTVL